MLDIKNNRLNYGEILMPPEGFHLVRAVGTTYSLDLYTILSIPVALFYAKSLEGDFKQNRYDVLDAIRQSWDKVTVFCQRGKIKAPAKYSSLLAFLENSIVEITPPSEYASFHPKIWVLRFEKKKEILYRVIILSRNLTFDRSWDLAYVAEGNPQKIINTEANKLAEYLSYFTQYGTAKIEKSFLTDLKKVAFDKPGIFESFAFHPILGFSKSQLKHYSNPLANARFKELMVVSPFIDESTVYLLSGSKTKLSLFSRKEELDKISPEYLVNKEVYCLNPQIATGELKLDSEDQELLQQNLHAKLFIGENGADRTWFLGSANCTRPAFFDNAEFLLELRSLSYKVGIKTMKEAFLDPAKPLFVPYDNDGRTDLQEDESIERLLRSAVFQLTKAKFTGEAVKRSGQETYNISLKADLRDIKIDPRFSVKARLIHKASTTQDLEIGLLNNFCFENIGLVNLSCFLVLDIHYQHELETSVLIKVDISIPEERNDSIFHELINSREKFYQYLQFLLDPHQLDSLLEIPDEDNALNIRGVEHVLPGALLFDAPIYEQLMIAASRSPEKLKEVNSVIELLKKSSSEAIDDFLPVWEVFKDFAK